MLGIGLYVSDHVVYKVFRGLHNKYEFGRRHGGQSGENISPSTIVMQTILP